MGLIFWVIFGALVGWSASIILESDKNNGLFLDIFFGIVGALLGGILMNFLEHFGIVTFNLISLTIAIMAAVFFITVERTYR